MTVAIIFIILFIAAGILAIWFALMRQADQVKMMELEDKMAMMEVEEATEDMVEEMEEVGEEEILKSISAIASLYDGTIVERERVTSTNLAILDEITYLDSQSETFSTIHDQRCLLLGDLNDEFNSFTPSTEAFDKAVQSEVLEFVQSDIKETLFIGAIVKHFEEGLVPISVCEGDEHAYVTFVEDLTTLNVGQWFNNSFFFFQAVELVSAREFTFVPEVTPNYSLVSSYYGDAGRLIWRYHFLDATTRTSDLVESCDNGLTNLPLYTGGVEEYDFACTREFVPNE